MRLLSQALKGAMIALLAVAVCPAWVQAEPYAYVANLGSDDVSVVDLATRSVVATIPAGDDPNGAASSPDGRAIYVTNFLSDSVTVIDSTTQTVSATWPVGTGPVGTVVSPDGQRLYVANRGADLVSVLDTADGAVVAEVSVGRGPNSVAVTPDGAKIYVTNSFSQDPGTVSVIDAASASVSADVVVQERPSRGAVSPDGRTLYVTNFRSWNVSVIDVETDRVTTTLRIAGTPSGVAANPNGAYVYVTAGDGRVEIIDGRTDLVVSELPVGARPFGIAVSRSGGFGFVANFDDATVTALDLADESVLGDIPVGVRPFAVVVNCVGEDCTAPPWTPKPTRTQTRTPTGTKTPRPPTPTATRTPTSTPRALVEIGGGDAAPGSTADVSVRLRTGGLDVIAVAVDLLFTAPLSVAKKENGRPDCAVNPAIGKPSTAFGFIPVDCPTEAQCTAVRAGVISFSGEPTLIADRATLFSCRVEIEPGARPGAHTVDGLRASVVLPSADEQVARVRAGTIEIGGRRSLLQAGSGERLHFCVGGEREGQPCSDREECAGGACVASVSICDGGADDGLLCECPGSECVAAENSDACGTAGGRCEGGEHGGACCDVERRCAGGSACVSTEMICNAGPSKGSPCLSDEHCPSASCSHVESFCLGGDFNDFACIDDRDCPRGTCFDPSAPTLTPAAAPPVSGGVSQSGDGDGCTIAVKESRGSAWLLALPAWLWARRRRPRSTAANRLVRTTRRPD